MAVRGGEGLNLLAYEWENAREIGKAKSGKKRLDNDCKPSSFTEPFNKTDDSGREEISSITK